VTAAPEQPSLLPDLAPMPELLQGDARALPLPDSSVDLIVTSPPYFGLRDYGTPGQLGAEPTPAEFIAALIECTREMVRVLKPSGSIFVNLGDKYAQKTERSRNGAGARKTTQPGGLQSGAYQGETVQLAGRDYGVPQKSLTLLPERYRIAAVDELGLIARAVIVWSKPNGLPESVTDRVRRSHEDWVHLTRSPKYFASVDEIREPYGERHGGGRSLAAQTAARLVQPGPRQTGLDDPAVNPLGKLPGSVWTIPTQPLRVPAELGIDHFAAFPMEWPRRIIAGWCPAEVCTACGEGRRPVVDRKPMPTAAKRDPNRSAAMLDASRGDAGRTNSGQEFNTWRAANPETITGYACACPDTTAPSTPGVVLDPFSGTGTTALVATMLGRRGIGVELNPDYVRLAEWRAQDPKQRAKAAGPGTACA
jgi:DNA modification methylase